MVPPGHDLCQEGDDADCMWILQEGIPTLGPTGGGGGGGAIEQCLLKVLHLNRHDALWADLLLCAGIAQERYGMSWPGQECCCIRNPCNQDCLLCDVECGTCTVLSVDCQASAVLDT